MLIPDMKALRSFYTHKHLFLLNPTKTPKSLSLSLVSRHVPPFSLQLHSSALRLRAELSGDPVELPGEKPDSGEAEDSKSAPRVWSIYRSVAGSTLSRTSVKKIGDREIEPGFSSLGKEVEDSDGERTYGSAKEENLSEDVETHTGLLGVDDQTDDLSKENGYSGLDFDQGGRSKVELSTSDEDSSEEKSYSSAKKNTLANVDKTRMGLVSYAKGDDRKRYGVTEKVGSSSGVGYGDTMRNRKKSKSKISWVCTDCGYTDGKWWGYCRECQKAGTMKQFSEGDVGNGNKTRGVQVSENVMRSWVPQKPGQVQPLRLKDLNQGMNQLEWRIPL